MPLFNLRTTFDAPTGLTADRVVWSWGIDEASMSFGDFSALAGVVETSLSEPLATGNNMLQYLQVGYTVLFHEIFEAEGGPALHVLNSPTSPTGGASAQPSEVQLVISRMIDTPRGVAPRGRLYVGPEGGTLGARPGLNRMNDHGEWAVLVHDGFLALGATPVVLHNAGTLGVTATDILEYRIDDRWDTQRRRGLSQDGPDGQITYTPV